MTRIATAAAVAAALLLPAGPAGAQWRYTDDKGASRVTQYKIDVPTPHRDAAEWVGPVGVGRPALSADQIRAARLWDAIQRIIAAEAGLLRLPPVAAPAPPRADPGPGGRPMTTMCIAGELRAMTSPGSWKVVGSCAGGFSTDYSTDGYGSVGGFVIR
jgi:choline dehydrogenase-like flavoprotein